MWLGSGVDVVVSQAGGYSSDLTQAWEPPYASGAAPDKAKKKVVFVWVQLIYNVVLVSGVQQSDSVYMYIYNQFIYI